MIHICHWKSSVSNVPKNTSPSKKTRPQKHRADRHQQYYIILEYIRYKISIFGNPVWTSLEHLILSLELVGLKLNEPYPPSSSKSQVSNSEVANFVVSQITPWISVDLLSYKWILINVAGFFQISQDRFQKNNCHILSWVYNSQSTYELNFVGQKGQKSARIGYKT